MRLLNDDELIEEAGSATFAAGESYVEQGRVSLIQRDHVRVTRPFEVPRRIGSSSTGRVTTATVRTSLAAPSASTWSP
jgi:hypothetical protein